MLNILNLKLAKVKGSKKLRKIIKLYRKFFGERDPGNIDFNFEERPSRMEIVQGIIDKKYNNYLEIGTFDDELFSYINAVKRLVLTLFRWHT